MFFELPLNNDEQDTLYPLYAYEAEAKRYAVHQAGKRDLDETSPYLPYPVNADLLRR